MGSGTWSPLPIPPDASPLQELIIKRLAELKLSYRDAAAKSSGLITFSTIAWLVQDRNRNPTERTLNGLALALDLPVEQLRKAVGPPDPAFRLPSRANKLTPAGRKAVVGFVDFLLDMQRNSV